MKENKKKQKQQEDEGGAKPQSDFSLKYSKVKNKEQQSVAASLIGGANINVFSQLSQIYMQRKNEQNGLIDESNQSMEQNMLGQQFEPEIQKVIGQLQKKSDVTKLKALGELKQLLEQKDELFFEEFLPTFTYLYKNFVNGEANFKMMLLANQILQVIIKIAKKKLQICLKKLFFYWILQQCDQNQEVRASAIQAFNIAFPLDKQSLVVKMCMNDYMQGFQNLLNTSLLQVKQENQNLQEIDCQEIYERNISAGFLSIKRCCELIASDADLKKDFLQKINIKLELDQTEFTQEGAIDRTLKEKKHLRIRAAFYEIIPFLEMNQKLINYMGKFIFQNLSENNSSIQASLWQYALNYLLQNGFDLNNDYQSKLLDNIEKQGYFIGKYFYMNINQVFGEFKNLKNIFYKKFFNNLLKGYQLDENKFYCDQLTISYFNCLLQLVSRQDCKDLQEIIDESIQNICQIYVQNNNDKMINIMQYKMIPDGLGKFVQQYQNFNSEILEKIFNKYCTQNEQKQNFFNIIKEIAKHFQANTHDSFISQLKLLNNSFIDSFKVDFLSDQNSQKLSENLQLYHKFLQFTEYPIISQIFISSEKDQIFKCLIQLINAFQTYSKNVFKIQNVEKLAFSIAQVLHNFPFKSEIIQTLNFDKYLGRDMILTSYILDSGLSMTHFSEFDESKETAQSIENFVYKNIQKPKKIMHQANQNIIIQYLKEFFSMKNPKELSQIPVIYDLLQICEVETINQINVLLQEFFSSSKNNQVNQLVYQIVAKFVNKNKNSSLSPNLNMFFQICLCQLKNDYLFQILKSLDSDTQQPIFMQIHTDILNCQQKLHCMKNNEFNIFISNVQQLLHFYKIKQQKLQIIKLFDDCILQNSIFDQSLSNERPWTYLRMCIEIVQDYIDPQTILRYKQIKEADFELYTWISCACYSFALQNNIKLKEFYNTLKNQIHDSIKWEDNQIYLSYFCYLLNRSIKVSLVFYQGARELVDSRCFQAVCDLIILDGNLIVDQENSQQKFLIAFNLLSKIQMSSNQTQLLVSICLTYMQQGYSSSFLPYVGLYSALNDKIEEQCIQTVSEILFQNNFQQYDQNFRFFVLFSFINKVFENQQFALLSEYIPNIEQSIYEAFAFNNDQKQFQSIVLSSLFQFLRKVINVLEIFTDNMKKYLKANFFQFCVQKIQHIQNKSQIAEDIEQLLIEMGETIQRFFSIIGDEFYEEPLFQLLNNPYPPLQKASVFLLQYHYKTNNPKIKEDLQLLDDENLLENIQLILPETLIEGLTNDHLFDDESDSQSIISPQSYAYLLNWVFFVSKGALKEQSQTNIIIRTVEKFVKIHCLDFLDNIFEFVTLLDIPEKEQKEIVINISQLSPEWSDFLNKKDFFRICIHTLYVFSTNFPIYLRLYFEQTDQKYQKISEYCLKSFIGPSLFQNEIESIELKQKDWVSDEFNIYVSKNTHEITAVYMKENTSLEITLKVPIDYPKKQLIIEYKKSVKISEMKINKWILRMKSLLMNQNNSIVNTLILWKENLDKEFENIEECPICYYIIHSSTKELPNLVCKTCKHKFHSTCIHKWFNTSNKSECPLCKSQFL